MNFIAANRTKGHLALLCVALVVFLLAGCEPMPAPAAATSTPISPTPTSASSEAVAVAPLSTIQDLPPLTSAEAEPPVRLAIPVLNLDADVVPMGWQMAQIGEQRTTVWVVPDDALGWHPNTAKAGAEGNTVISGHQLLGDALLAPLSLGEVAPGQEIHVTDREGRIFVYQIREVSEPQVISEEVTEEEDLNAALTNQSGTPRLTLITGWPDFSSTHRIYAVAPYIGTLP